MIVLSGWAILHVHAVLSVVRQYCLDAIETVTLCNREAVSSHKDHKHASTLISLRRASLELAVDCISSISTLLLFQSR